MTPASKVRAQHIRQQFAAAVAVPDAAINLARAALLIAAEEQPHVDVTHYLLLLDEMGEHARMHLAHSSSPSIEAFNHFMFREMNFAGNQLDYYDARNSFLNEVLDRRTGIPITLSIVYMEVGSRAGLDTEGVGLPGHFIVRAHEKGAAEATLVDPFRGKTLSLEECQGRMDELYNGRIALTPEHLRAATTREILVRMLTNLKAIYARAKLYQRALGGGERILLLIPDDPTEHRDRGALLGQLDRLPEAMAETKFYLQAARDAPDSQQVRERLQMLQKRQAMRN